MLWRSTEPALPKGEGHQRHRRHRDTTEKDAQSQRQRLALGCVGDIRRVIRHRPRELSGLGRAAVWNDGGVVSAVTYPGINFGVIGFGHGH
ncbi:hypothetical protein ACTXG5_11120 [Mycobacterium sp. Dal123C01]|uniref:hypothetical protein n=1 Tax=Mycobacterium sp. Dal123C01 TaxID=3457577 RepID=UPI00403E5AEF